MLNPIHILKLKFKQKILDTLHRLEIEVKNHFFHELATIGKGVKFYEQSSIHNLQNDKQKIIVGNNTHIRGELLIFKYGGEISIGDYVYIGEGTKIWSGEKVFIGNNVLISHNCNIVDTDSHELNYNERAKGFQQIITTGHLPEKGTIKTAPVIIEDNAWLSFNVSLLKGVRIGKGAIIGANTLVTSDVEAYTVVAGNPFRLIKRLEN